MGRLLGAKGCQLLECEQFHTQQSMVGVAELLQELRLQDSSQLQRQNEEACQQAPSSETFFRLHELAGTQLKEGKISEALRTETQIAEIQLQSWGPLAHDSWDGLLGIKSRWELAMSWREAAPEQAQKVDAEPTMEELLTPKMDLATALKELKEQHRAAQKLQR